MKAIILATALLFCYRLSFAFNMQGKVVDQNAKGIAYAVIRIKNKAIAVYTDSNGHFTINTEKSDTLVFSCVGYKTVEYGPNVATSVGSIQIVMNTILTELREVSISVKKRKCRTGILGTSLNTMAIH